MGKTTKGNGGRKMKDYTGKRFGSLVAIKPLDKRDRGSVVWECKCDCGDAIEVPSRDLSKNKVTSCGCNGSISKKAEPLKTPGSSNFKDLTGQKFGMLTVTSLTNKRDKKGSVIWECQCDCGNTCKISASALKKHKNPSCGCTKIYTKKVPTYVKKDVVSDKAVPISAIYEGEVPDSIKPKYPSMSDIFFLATAVSCVVVGSASDDPVYKMVCVATGGTLAILNWIIDSVFDKLEG